MRRKEISARILGGVALALSVTAFTLGTAPFTPAMVLSVIALPLAVLSYILEARRLALLAVYWITASFLVVPLSRTLQFRLDYLLVLLGISGLVLTTVIYVTYSRTKSVV
jgi:hypothetical protein